MFSNGYIKGTGLAVKNKFGSQMEGLIPPLPTVPLWQVNFLRSRVVTTWKSIYIEYTSATFIDALSAIFCLSLLRHAATTVQNPIGLRVSTMTQGSDVLPEKLGSAGG